MKTHSILQVTIEILFDYALNRRFINEHEKANYILGFSNVIHEVLMQNSYSLKESDYGLLVVSAIQDTIEHNPNSFVEINATQKIDDEKIIYHNDQYIFIRAEMLLNIILSYYDRQRSYFPYDTTKQLIDLLKQKKLIKFETTGEHRSSFKLPNQRINSKRYLYIIKSRMSELLNNN